MVRRALPVGAKRRVDLKLILETLELVLPSYDMTRQKSWFVRRCIQKGFLMGNRITNRAYSDFDSLKMNNGLTDVFIDVLALSASALASTEREKLFAVWLACHDQNVCGVGTVGFDISDMPWTVLGFQAQKDFLMKVIRAAQKKEYWHLLGYQPGREDWVLSSLEQFRALIAHFSKENIVPEEKRRTARNMPSALAQCPKHGVYVHQLGCVLCNGHWDGSAWRFPQD